MDEGRNLGADDILQLIFIYLTEVSSLRDHDEIISVLADMGRALTYADRCSIWIVSEDKKKLWTKVSQGIDAIEVDIKSGIVGAAVTSGKRITIDDVYEDERFNKEIDKQTGYRTKSMMVMPMYDNEDQIIGAFQVINHKGPKGKFDIEDTTRLMLASTYTAETLIAAQLVKEVQDTQREVIFRMGAIGESRSRETGNHVKRVAEYSKMLALEYGLSEEEAEMLKQVSPMHDIGKVAIPDSVLNKPGRFNAEERAIMDTHAELGYSMLNTSQRPLLKAASVVAYEHHEKWNGKGYPQGLAGEDIHIYGRITALADVFDALGSDRVYKKAWSDERIFKLLREERGEHFDPKLIDIFFDNLDKVQAIRATFVDNYIQADSKSDDKLNQIKILGAFGTRFKGHGTTSILFDEENVMDAGNLLNALEEDSRQIRNVWITHSHLDHIHDLAYLVDNYFEKLEEPIVLRGLPGTLEAIQKHFFNDVIWPDFSKIKLYNSSKVCIEYKEIELEHEYALKDATSIQAFKTDHTDSSCGYIYKKNGAGVLITADTVSLENVIKIVNKDLEITSMVLECSFPSSMEKLAIASKHLTPKMLLEELKGLQREDIEIYINHVKPLYLIEITKEIEAFFPNKNMKILKDGEIVKF